jgi:hypothetical protein
MGSDGFVLTVWTLVALWLLTFSTASYLAYKRRSWRWTIVALGVLGLGLLVYSIIVRVLE